MAISMQDDVAVRPPASEPEEQKWELGYFFDEVSESSPRLDKRVCLMFWLGVSAVGWGFIGLLVGHF